MLPISSKLKSVILALLILLVVLGILSQSSKVKEGLSPSLYGRVVLFVLSPLQNAISFTKEQSRSLFDRYVFLIGVEKENKKIKAKVNRLQKELFFFQAMKIENQRLQSIVDFQEALEWDSIAARVIGHSPLAEFQMLTINKGEKDGIVRRMPVVAQQGLVGQIYRTTAHTAQILLITDLTSVVDGIIYPSRERALVVGKVDKVSLGRPFQLTRLEYLRQESDVHEGNVVMTSGMDEIFPPGIPIGKARLIKKGPHGLFKSADMVANVSLDQLNEVLVLLRKKKREI
jgi:rod shape-determining protein MreC